jgi:hypothetical protein
MALFCGLVQLWIGLKSFSVFLHATASLGIGKNKNNSEKSGNCQSKNKEKTCHLKDREE